MLLRPKHRGMKSKTNKTDCVLITVRVEHNGITLEGFQHQQCSKAGECSIMQPSEKVIGDVDVNAGGTILFKSPERLAYVDDFDLIGRTSRDVQTAFGLNIN